MPAATPTAPSWFTIRNAATSADVTIYGRIGTLGIPAADFTAKIRALRVSLLTVRINSEGGSVFDGFAIYNALCAHAARKIVIVEGLAASIASVIAMAGDEIRVCSNALLMVHNPSVTCTGRSADMLMAADLLDKLAANMAEIYSARSKITAEEARALMAAETWLGAADCLAKGLCTAIEPAKSA